MSVRTVTRFPFVDRPRLWGVAISHYQVEGNDPCDWTDWEAAGKTRGAPCGDAADSWTRYEEDARLARAAGANAFRFSISWSRVEPQRGVFDDAVLARYRRFVDTLVALGIEPVVTLFHYTHPRWFHQQTPWTSTASVLEFGRFAGRVADALGHGVRFWVILNEPLVFLLAGYLDGQIPPGISDTRTLNRVFDHLLAAHCAAASEIRVRNRHAAIGIAHNMMGFAPERESNPFDGLLARTAHTMYNRGIMEAFATGRWNFLLPPGTTIRGRRDELPSWLDAFGINFYSRLHMRCEAALSGFPLLITENGIADADDRLRPQYLRMHAQEIRKAEARGIAIHGYFHWSLLDNYEWLDGFEPRFGLYAVDRQTLQRTPRPSVEVFKELGRDFTRSLPFAQTALHVLGSK